MEKKNTKHIETFTQIPNNLIEVLLSQSVNESEGKILLLIARKTWGFHKREDQISLTQFQEATGLSRQTVVVTLKRLQLVKLIRLVKKGRSKRGGNTYQIDLTDYENKLVKLGGLVKYIRKQLVKQVRHTKESITKEITKVKDKPFSKKKPSSKEKDFRGSLRRVVRTLEANLDTKIVNWGKQGKALKAMYAAGYTESQVLVAIEEMAEDSFWKTKGFDLTTVSNEIPRIRTRLRGEVKNGYRS